VFMKSIDFFQEFWWFSWFCDAQLIFLTLDIQKWWNFPCHFFVYVNKC
jgi:hypothetical protein